MKSYVYLIERVDSLCYVGITINPEKRFKSHEKSDRFGAGIKKKVILAECNSYEEAEDLEEYYINQFDTYNNGLNLTSTGKGKSDCKFNTMGHVFSKESREKMSESAKKRGPTSIGHKHSNEVKKHWSELRKNRYWGNNKLVSNEDAELIYKSYINDEIQFDLEFIKSHVKKKQRDCIEELKFEDLVSPNGKSLSKIKLYSEYYAERFEVTSAAIRRIIETKGVRCEAASSKE